MYIFICIYIYISLSLSLKKRISISHPPSCHSGSDDMCKCGCRGWDTLYPLLLAWVKDLQYLEAGSKLRCAVLDIQDDWPAFLQFFWMRYWSHKTHPCPLCRIIQSEIQQLNLDAITLDSMPYAAYSSNDYLKDVEQSVKASGFIASLEQVN